MNWDLVTEEPSRASQFGRFGSLQSEHFRRDAKCRVIAVSGLASEPHWEWTSYSPETRIACNWLSELLPKYARHSLTETFRYNLLPGSIGGFLSSDGITQAARRLLELIDRSSPMIKAAPIVFVAHDLGGIVVKKALLMAGKIDKFQYITRKCQRIIFFGTPHRALDRGSWEDLMLGIVIASPAKLRIIPNMSTRLGDLSTFLENLSGNFLAVSGEYRIISVFQQVNKNSRDQPVLPPYSATMGVVHEAILPRVAKHENLATFFDENDPVFIHIAKVIKAESDSLYQTNTKRIARAYPPCELFRSHDTDLHRFLELSLWKRPKNGAKPDVLEFLDTQLSTADSLFAIGEGSLDARALYQCLRSNERTVGYFSPSDHNVRLRTPISLVGSFILQVLVQTPQLYKHVSAMIEAMVNESAYSGRIMATIFRRMLEKAASVAVKDDKSNVFLYLLVENIPVNEPRWENAVEFLQSLQGTTIADEQENPNKPHIKILWLYDRRKVPDIAKGKEAPWAPAEMVDPVTIFGRKQLKQFATALVNGYYYDERRPNYRSLILDHCGYDAELIYCSRVILEKDHAMLVAIEKSSADHPPVSEFLARKIEQAFRQSSRWVKVAIGWLIHANRPLTGDELQAAVRLSCKEPDIDIYSMKMHLGELIYASTEEIWFPNKTIRDHFRQAVAEARDNSTMIPAEVKLPDEQAIADVLVACIPEERGAAGSTDMKLALQKYAFQFWRDHIRDAAFDAQKIVALSQNEGFIKTRKKIDFDNFWKGHEKAKSLSVEGPLALAVQIGLPDAVTELVERTSSHQEIGAAILMAARLNNKDMVSVLVTSDALADTKTIRPYLEAALELAAQRHSIPIMTELLGHLDKSVNLHAGSGASLLSSLVYIAAKFDQVDMLRLLVSTYGARVNVSMDDKMKPLQQAVSFGHIETARFLVQEAGATIYPEEGSADDETDSMDSRSAVMERIDKDANALYIAAEYGYTAIAEFLLDNTVVQHGDRADSESATSAENCSTDGDKTSSVKYYAPWSAIEDALIIAFKWSHVDTAKRIFHHSAVSSVPKRHRPFNSTLLCSALRAEPRPGPKSLAIEMLRSCTPSKRVKDLDEPFVAAAEAGQVDFIEHCLAVDSPDTVSHLLSSIDRVATKALCGAAASGHADAVKCLLDHGVDVNPADASHSSPLALAAVGGYARIVQILLSHGADVAWVGTTSRGIVSLAAVSPSCERQVEVIRLLLQAGAPVNAFDNSKMTALHWAARRGHINILEVLLSQPDIDLAITGDSDMNAIHSAAQSTSRNAVEATAMLMAAGVSAHKPDADGWLPLHLAAAANNVDLMEFLLSRDANGINARANNGSTVLHAAYKMCEAMIWLIDHDFDVDVESSDGRTPLMGAAKSGIDASVGLLLAFGANTDMLDRLNRSALHYAVDARSEVISNMLLDANPAVLFQLDSTGTSILYTAITRGMTKFSLKLLDEFEKYAKEHKMQDEMVRVLDAAASATDRSPVILAARRVEADIVERILKLGGSIDKRDYLGSSALVYAIEKGNERIAKAILESRPNAAKGEANRFVMFLEPYIMQTPDGTKDGDKHDAKDDDTDDGDPDRIIVDTGRNIGFWVQGYPAALQSAAAVGQVDMVKLLLSYNVDINEQSGQYNTALTAAAAGGFSQAVGMLLEHGADTTLPGGSYPNALGAAVASTSSATIDLLLTKDEQAALTRDIQGRNSLHVAVQSRSLDAFEKILTVVTNLNKGKDWAPANSALGPDRQGRRILHFAASSGDVDTLRYFLEHPKLQLKDEIDILDNDGWTPLHWACRLNEGEECVQLLLQYDSDPSLETRDGWTPLNIAQYHDATDSAKLITSALVERAQKIAERNNAPVPDMAEITGRKLEPGHLNWGVSCDGCLLMPSIGACYKCKDCVDFDYCFKCHWSADSTHYEGHTWQLRKGTPDPGGERGPPSGVHRSTPARMERWRRGTGRPTL